mmetsp:Transcript_86385/g.239556  ORF Transcript_86385/g.239556 Transcript_86385/m.239556 type:complete len:236 (+) Transcript_86385:100-807(+)
MALLSRAALNPVETIPMLGPHWRCASRGLLRHRADGAAFPFVEWVTTVCQDSLRLQECPEEAVEDVECQGFLQILTVLSEGVLELALGMPHQDFMLCLKLQGAECLLPCQDVLQLVLKVVVIVQRGRLGSLEVIVCYCSRWLLILSRVCGRLYVEPASDCRDRREHSCPKTWKHGLACGQRCVNIHCRRSARPTANRCLSADGTSSTPTPCDLWTHACTHNWGIARFLERIYRAW